MKIALAIFVKTPGLSPIKTRLAKSTSERFASDFYHQSLLVTSTFVQSLQYIFKEMDLFWAVAEEEGLTSEHWKDFKQISQGTGDLGMRLNKVYSSLIKKYDAVFFMGADSPHLSYIDIGKDINNFLEDQKSKFMLGNTRDGGYYFFGGKTPLLDSIWINVRYSSTFTALDFSQNLKSFGNIFLIKESFDIDEKIDLDIYKSPNFSSEGLLQEQKDFIQWIINNVI